MDKEVEHYVKSCYGCQITNRYNLPNYEPLKPTKIPSGPLEDLAGTVTIWTLCSSSDRLLQ
jgi:hypothetical protein